MQVGRLHYDTAALCQCDRSCSQAPEALLKAVELLKTCGPPPWARLVPWDPSGSAAGCGSPSWRGTISEAYRGGGGRFGSPQLGHLAPNGGRGWGALRGLGGLGRGPASPTWAGSAGRAGTGAARGSGRGGGPMWNRGGLSLTPGRHALSRPGLGSAMDITALGGSDAWDPGPLGVHQPGTGMGPPLRRQRSLPLINAATEERLLQPQAPEQRSEADTWRRENPIRQAPLAPMAHVGVPQAPAGRSDADSWWPGGPDAPRTGAATQPGAPPGDAGSWQPAGAGPPRPEGFAERYASKTVGSLQAPVSEPRRSDAGGWRPRPPPPPPPVSHSARAPSPLIGASSGGSQGYLSELLGLLTKPGGGTAAASALHAPPGLGALPSSLRRSLSLPRLDNVAGEWAAGSSTTREPTASCELSPVLSPMRSPMPERLAGERTAAAAAPHESGELGVSEDAPDLLAVLQQGLARVRVREGERNAGRGEQGQSQGLRAAPPEHGAGAEVSAQDLRAAGTLKGPGSGAQDAEHAVHEPSWGLAAEQELGLADAAAVQVPGVNSQGLPRPAKELSNNEGEVQGDAWRTAAAQGLDGPGQGLPQVEQEPGESEGRLEGAGWGASSVRGGDLGAEQCHGWLAARAEERSSKLGMHATHQITYCVSMTIYPGMFVFSADCFKDEVQTIQQRLGQTRALGRSPQDALICVSWPVKTLPCPIMQTVLCTTGLEANSPERAPVACQQQPPKGEPMLAMHMPQPPVKPAVSLAALAAPAAGLGPGVARILRPLGLQYAEELPSRPLTVGVKPQAAGYGPGLQGPAGPESGQEPAEGAKPATAFARRARKSPRAAGGEPRGAAGGSASPEDQGPPAGSWGAGEPRPDELGAAEGAAGPEDGIKPKRCAPAPHEHECWLFIRLCQRYQHDGFSHAWTV